eukprot:SAG11_NODE_157_length_14147_cov_8.545202_16_plen_192_part_00
MRACVRAGRAEHRIGQKGFAKMAINLNTVRDRAFVTPFVFKARSPTKSHMANADSAPYLLPHTSCPIPLAGSLQLIERLPWRCSPAVMPASDPPPVMPASGRKGLGERGGRGGIWWAAAQLRRTGRRSLAWRELPLHQQPQQSTGQSAVAPAGEVAGPSAAQFSADNLGASCSIPIMRYHTCVRAIMMAPP